MTAENKRKSYTTSKIIYNNFASNPEEGGKHVDVPPDLLHFPLPNKAPSSPNFLNSQPQSNAVDSKSRRRQSDSNQFDKQGSSCLLGKNKFQMRNRYGWLRAGCRLPYIADKLHRQTHFNTLADELHCHDSNRLTRHCEEPEVQKKNSPDVARFSSPPNSDLNPGNPGSHFNPLPAIHSQLAGMIHPNYLAHKKVLQSQELHNRISAFYRHYQSPAIMFNSELVMNQFSTLFNPSWLYLAALQDLNKQRTVYFGRENPIVQANKLRLAGEVLRGATRLQQVSSEDLSSANLSIKRERSPEALSSSDMAFSDDDDDDDDDAIDDESTRKNSRTISKNVQFLETETEEEIFPKETKMSDRDHPPASKKLKKEWLSSGRFFQTNQPRLLDPCILMKEEKFHELDIFQCNF